MTAITLTIAGLEPFRKKLRESSRLVDAEFNPAMMRAVLWVEGSAKMKAPVDTGELRRSLTHHVGGYGAQIEGEVGTNLFYAPYMEYGTGRLTDGEGGTGGKHWPPSGALDLWARRHGFGENAGWVVARAIGRRGGLKPRRFLRNAFKVNMNRIVSEFEAALERVLNRIAAE